MSIEVGSGEKALKLSSNPFRLGVNSHGRYTSGDLGNSNFAACDENFVAPVDEVWEAISKNAKACDSMKVLRFLYEGLIFPKKDRLMVRCRMTGGELTTQQLIGIAQISRSYGAGSVDITTRGNLQIRDISFDDGITVLRDLMVLQVAPCVRGVNNLRNITVSPTTGFDPYEVMDVMPIARSLSEALIFHPSLQGLPGKFNVALDSGGGVGVSAEANDLGFYAITTASGPRFRMHMAGAGGVDVLASDVGISIAPEQVVPIAAAVVAVFLREGDFSQRRRSRLRYLVERVGVGQMLKWVNEVVALPLIWTCAKEEKVECNSAMEALQFGEHRQLGVAKQYLGLVIPAGRLSADQLDRIADVTGKYGSSRVRMTVWQNVLIPDVCDSDVIEVKRLLRGAGLSTDINSAGSAMVACTGSKGCGYSATDTKAHSLEVAQIIDDNLVLDQPVNIHFTGCKFSCAQNAVGDIGLLGTRVKGEEAYHISVGSSAGAGDHLIFRSVLYQDLAVVLLRMLSGYQLLRENAEGFSSWTERHTVEELRQFFEGEGRSCV